MYDTETKNQFIELRAQGLSLDAISAQLSVPKTTLGRWHHESLEQIQRLRALQWHLLEDQIGERLEDTLTHIAQRIRKWDDKLDRQLTVYQKPGDSIRVIRESRREYLQLRALLLAPLQPARRDAPCRISVESEKRDKTGQNPDALETTPLPPNDLQQTEIPMSHFPVTPDVKRGLALPELFTNPFPASANAVRDPATDQSKIQNPQSKIDSPSAASPGLCVDTGQTGTVVADKTPMRDQASAKPSTAGAVPPQTPSHDNCLGCV